MAKYIVGRKTRNRNKIIRYCLFIGLYLLLAVVIQTSLLSRIKPFGGVPDIILPSIVCISMYCGCYAGAVTGICAGFVTDALGATGYSLLPLIYFLVGYLFGYYVKVLNVKGYLPYLVGALIGIGVRMITTLILTLLSASEFRLSVFMTSTALPEMLATAIFSLAVYFPASAVCKALIKRDGGYRI